MDLDQSKKQVLTHFDAAQARQAEGIRDTESRRGIRRVRFQRFFSSAIAGAMFGWIAFIIGKANQNIAGFQIAIAAACGAALAYAYSIRKERVHRDESAQIRRVVSLSGFKKSYDRAAIKAFVIFGSYFVLLCVGVPFVMNYYPHAAISRFIDRSFLYLLGSGFASLLAIFYVSHSKLYRVSCPQCGNRLNVRSSRPALENTYSGLCETCGILWDLDVANSD